MDRLPSLAARVPRQVLRRMRFLRRTIACGTVLRKLPGTHISIEATLGAVLFRFLSRARVWQKMRRPIRRHRARKKKSVQKCLSRIKEACAPWEKDEWYRAGTCWGDTRGEIRSIRADDKRAVSAAKQETRTACHRQQLRGARRAKAEVARRLCELWTGTPSDQIGQFFASKLGARIMLTVLPALIAYGMTVWLAVSGEHTAAVMVGFAALLWASGTWSYLDACVTLSSYVRGRYGILILAEGAGRTRKWILRPGFSYSIGGGADSDIVLNDKKVSPNHATIESRSGRFFVREVKTTSRTYVRGKAASGMVRLSDGDSVRVGTTILRFRRIIPENSGQNGQEKRIRRQRKESSASGER